MRLTNRGEEKCSSEGIFVMRNARVKLVLVLMMIFCFGVWTANGSPPNMQKSNEAQSVGGQPLKARQPYFRISEGQRQVFVDKVQQVKIGDTRQSVESLLGKPDFDILTGKKEKPQATGRRVRYYVTMYEKDGVNERFDESVTFRFDLSDHLRRIDSSVPGISSR